MKFAIRDLNPVPSDCKGGITLPMFGYHQTDAYSCGVTAVHATLKAAGISLPFGDLWDVMRPDPVAGTPATRVLATLRALGVKSTTRLLNENTVRRSLLAGDPLLVSARMDHQPEHQEHWMVIAGVRLMAEEVLLLNHTRRPGYSQVWWPMEKLEERCSTGRVIRASLHLQVRKPLTGCCL